MSEINSEDNKTELNMSVMGNPDLLVSSFLCGIGLVVLSGISGLHLGSVITFNFCLMKRVI